MIGLGLALIEGSFSVVCAEKTHIRKKTDPAMDVPFYLEICIRFYTPRPSEYVRSLSNIKWSGSFRTDPEEKGFSS